MSGNDTGSGPLSRGARILLGGLASGAILSTAIAAQPAAAAAADSIKAGVSASVTEAGAPVSYFAEQFRDAFTPGAISAPDCPPGGVIVGSPS